jgi:hypothetical protein
LSSEMRTLALCPLLLAISPSRIRMLRVMEFFQPPLTTRNLPQFLTALAKFLFSV